MSTRLFIPELEEFGKGVGTLGNDDAGDKVIDKRVVSPESEAGENADLIGKAEGDPDQHGDQLGGLFAYELPENRRQGFHYHGHEDQGLYRFKWLQGVLLPAEKWSP